MCSPEDAEVPDESGVPARSLDQLEQEICELAAHIAAATCTWLLLVAEFDQRRGWAQWGVKSCADWLSWRCSITLVTAREHVRVAGRLTQLPLIRETFGRGELSYSKVRALSRVAEPETEASLVEMARHATGGQLERLVRGYRGVLRATDDAARVAHARRELECSWDDGGMLIVRGRLTADEGALLLSALEAAGSQQPVDEDADCPVAARRADALVEVARSAIAGGLPDRPGGDPCELVVHVDADSLAGERIAARSEVEAGPALAPETMRRLGCDASVTRILERDGTPLSVGRRTRTIPPALRRALRSRDRGRCQFPGCDHTRHLHAHHIRHWARGGPTSIDNLVVLCSFHHHLVHEGGYAVERCAGQVSFRTPGGRPIPRRPDCPRAVGPGIRERNRGRRLAIDADTPRALSAGDRLDYDLAVMSLIDQRPAGGRPPSIGR